MVRIPAVDQPKGKTHAKILSDIHQTDLKHGDMGYIDGYVRAGDSRPYAVFVRYSDGLIDFVPLHALRAGFDKH